MVQLGRLILVIAIFDNVLLNVAKKGTDVAQKLSKNFSE